MQDTFEQPTILVVDDTEANIDILVETLADRYDIAVAMDGESALEVVEEEPPDLILLDIMMPGMDGYEVCRRLKADPRFQSIPVLFISALSDAADKVKAFSEGGVDYVAKPFQPEEVIARVATHLELRRLRVELEEHNLDLQQKVADQVREISESQMATIFALAKLAESRDDDTGKHIERVQAYCEALATRLSCGGPFADVIDEAVIRNLSQASVLHDIGKVGVSDAILCKPGKLTPEEFEIIKTHTTIGADTLAAVHGQYPANAFITMGIEIARSHHEKWDGSGYPEGLSGEDIPLCARIMALADVYDALTSERCYKKVLSHEESRDTIVGDSGSHFDPAVVDAFVELADEFDSIRQQTIR